MKKYFQKPKKSEETEILKMIKKSEKEFASGKGKILKSLKDLRVSEKRSR